MSAKELVKIAYNALDDKKGQDICIINIEEISTVADYFIIASGDNRNQVQAIADNVSDELAKVGCEVKQTEGYHSAN